MGYTCLARWPAAPPSGLQMVRDHLSKNQNVQAAGPWSVSVKSYRSQLAQFPGYQNTPERIMYSISMDGNVFALVEDPRAPSRADVLAAAPPGQEVAWLQNPSHYRHTFITARPPGALEQLMNQIKAPWMAVRQTAASATNPRNQSAGQQISIEGFTYAIGNDWLLRIGNVVLAGGAVRGMLFEAEYLPLPVFHSEQFEETPQLLSNFILSVLPPSAVGALVAVAVGDAQWDDVLWDREEYFKASKNSNTNVEDNNDPNAWEIDDIGGDQSHWVGVNRDQRSAYLIVGALRSESLL